MEKEKKQNAFKIHGATGRCPFCRDLITDPKQVVACAGCGARQHEQCFAEHGACASCGAADVLVPRSRAPHQARELPPKGSKIEVERAEDHTAFSWQSANPSQLILLTVILGMTFFLLPILPFVFAFWWARRHKQSRLVLGADTLTIHLDGPIRSKKTVIAKREDVGAIRLNRWGSVLTLSVDVGVERIKVVTGGHGQPSPLKEPEIEWLYEQLQAWKDAG